MKIFPFFLIMVISSCSDDHSATFDILSEDIKNGRFDQISTFLQLHSTSNYKSADSLDFVLKDLFENRINDSLKKLYNSDIIGRQAKIDSLNYFLEKAKTPKHSPDDAGRREGIEN